MTWVQLIAENRILEAIEKGEFDCLPGQGQPLDLNDYFAMPVSDRMAMSLLKSAGVMPPEIQLLKEAEEMEAKLKATSDVNQRLQLRQQIQSKQVTFAMSVERRRHAARTDSGLELAVF